MGIRQEFQREGDVLTSKLNNELAAVVVIEGCAHLSNGNVAVDFANEPSAQDLIDAQAVIDAHDATDYEQLFADAADTRFQNARDDFRALIDILGPAYDSLTPQQRATQIANFGNLQGLTETQFRNAMGFGLALYSIGLDYLERRK